MSDLPDIAASKIFEMNTGITLTIYRQLHKIATQMCKPNDMWKIYLSPTRPTPDITQGTLLPKQVRRPEKDAVVIADEKIVSLFLQHTGPYKDNTLTLPGDLQTTVLNVANNRLVSLNDIPTSVKVLSCEVNDLKELQLDNCESLITLNCSCNLLSKELKLPHTTTTILQDGQRTSESRWKGLVLQN